jgi:xanthine dehydrogenase accessory factor
MRDILDDLRAWYEDGTPVGLATVIDTRHSAPRDPGAAMAVDANGEVVGSVSGGCVEGAVFEEAQQVLSSGAPKKLSYGISDEQAFSVGLTCGGEIDLFVERLDSEHVPFFEEVASAISAEEPVAVATVVEGSDEVGAKLAVWRDHAEGSLGSAGLDAAVAEDARGMLAQGVSGTRHYGVDGRRQAQEVAVFVATFAPPARLLVFGAIDFAKAVAGVGKFLGYHVTVCDARAIFATEQRFPDADEVVVSWPHRYLEKAKIDSRTVICVLTHDPKFDVPALQLALRSEAAFVGAMGSRRTHEDRVQRLKEAGVTNEELARLRSPIGLDVGARTPEEVAVAVAAEIIQQRWGGSCRPLTETGGRVHEPARVAASA